MQQGAGQVAAAEERPRGMSWSSIITQLLIFWMISNLFFRKNDTTEDPFVTTITETELTTENNNQAQAQAQAIINSKEAGKIPCLFHSEQELVCILIIIFIFKIKYSKKIIYSRYKSFSLMDKIFHSITNLSMRNILSH